MVENGILWPLNFLLVYIYRFKLILLHSSLVIETNKWISDGGPDSITVLNLKALYPLRGNWRGKQQICYWCRCVWNGMLDKDCKMKVNKSSIYNDLVGNSLFVRYFVPTSTLW